MVLFGTTKSKTTENAIEAHKLGVWADFQQWMKF